MAGINNAEFCATQKAALVVLGGFNADRAAMRAAELVTARGRKEFIFKDPLDGIEQEVERIAGRKNFAVNVRAAGIEGYIRAAEIADAYGGILEVNAHCRQPEFVAAKCGEWLLFNSDRLLEIVRKASKVAVVSVKIRGGHNIDYVKLCRKLFEAGCSIVHVDAMIPDAGCDLNLIRRLSQLGFVIGNNSFVDVRSGEAIIAAGAAMASAARAVLKDAAFFEKMLRSKILSQPVEL